MHNRKFPIILLILEKVVNIFLLKINRVRAAGKKIVYSDETYINQNHITPKSWCSSEDLARAAGKEGELADSRKTWWSNETTGDYHGNVTSILYEEWFEQHLLPNIPPNSAIILDNAAYHKRKVDEFPLPEGRTINTLLKSQCIDGSSL